MALDNLIGEVWAASFLNNLDHNFVYGNTINRDYNGEMSFGDRINIDKMGAVSIIDYVKNTDMTDPEILDTDQQTLIVDQQKAFNFFIDSIDEAQSKPMVMQKAMERSAYAMGNVVDVFLANFYADATTSVGAVATPETPDADTIYDIITQAAQVLDQQNVPTAGRYIIMNTVGIRLLRNAGEMLVATAYGDQVRTTGGIGTSAPVGNGYMGMVGGFEVWMSTNTPSSGASSSIWQAGHPMGISMVEQVNQIVGYQPQLRFGDAVKGLYTYGAAALQPDAIVPIYTTL